MDMTEARHALEALIQRWDAFLQQVEDLFLTTLSEAGPRLVCIVENKPTDTQQLLVSWGALKSQLQSLIAKSGEVFQDTLSPQLEKIGFSGEIPGYDLRRESNKYTDLETRLHLLLEQEENRILGECAEIYYTKTLESARLQLQCTQCASPMEVSGNIFRAHYEQCSYCSTVNTYEPSTQLRGVEWFTLNHLATYRCSDAYDKLQDFHRRLSTMRMPLPGPFMEAMEKAHRNYYSAFLQERIRIIPELEQQYEEDLGRHMDDFQAFRERYSRH